MTMTSTCAICGGLIETSIPSDWHPSKLTRTAERNLQDHMLTHSFAEILRSEIRQDLDQVPEDERPIIVRDIYRNLLGTMDGSRFILNGPDSRGVYSIDDVLGHIDVYRLWRAANQCFQATCGCRA